ncbi:MAG TPA: FG-GAP-like repeat-containing protein, partial [Pyrinomonadaceae bacterium]|nr:FG-GAP-like repeat-containing protein [Pyrinomonadaceae bacterium]
GTFGAAVNFTTGNVPFSVVAADLDGDGKTDLATADRPNSVSVLLNGCQSACGDVDFAAASDLGAGDAPTSVAVGDFNRDGKADLAAANRDAASISVLLGDGAGGFGPKTDFPAGSPWAVTVGDFNGDGRADLAAANFGHDNVSILLGDGAGAFGPKTDFPVGSAPDAITSGDFNRDGRLDLATANRTDSTVSVLLGDGAGAFSPKTDFGVGSAPASVVTADFNSDGHTDLATANLSSDNVSVLLGTKTGAFDGAINFGVSFGPSSVTVGDFNGDGEADIAAANFSSQNVSILLGLGDGTFSPKADFAAGSFPYSVAAGDFDDDGRLDLAVANSGSTNVSLLLGNGDGTFDPKSDFGAGTGPIFVTTGDFNRDGKADLAAANFYSDDVSVLLNDCQPSADLHLTVTDSPDPALIGGQITYTVAVRDRGPIDATGVGVSAALPSTLAFVSASLGCTHTGEPAGGTVTCDVGDLPRGAANQETLTIVTQALAAGVSTTTIEVAGNDFDDFLSNNKRLVTTTAVTLNRVTLSAADAIGGCSGSQPTGTVKLSGQAPSGGATVLLSSSAPSALEVPASVQVAGGQTTATFNLTPKAVAALTAVTVTATLQTALTPDPQKAAAFSVRPIRVQSLALGQGSVQGGTQVTNNVVTLTCAAAADTAVALTSDNPAVASVPSGFEVPAGSASNSFTITTGAVATTRRVAIRAALNGKTVTQVLTVTP